MKVNFAPDFETMWDALDSEVLAILEQNNLDDPKHERLPPVQLWTNGEKPNIVIDGHHTYRIRTKHNLKIRYVKLEFSDRLEALRYAKGIQVGRRNLTDSQRAFEVAEWHEKQRQPAGRPCAPKSQNTEKTSPKNVEATATLDSLAKAARVSKRTMSDATKVVDKGAKEVKQSVRAGQHSVSDAAAVVGLTKRQQARLAAQAAKEKSTLKEAAEKNGDVTDANGTHVPKQLVDIFLRGKEFEEQAKLLTKVQQWAEKIKGDPSGAWLHVQSLVADLDNAKRALRFNKPYAVCPYCHAKKKSCDGCHGNGFVNRSIYNGAPQELRV